MHRGFIAWYLSEGVSVYRNYVIFNALAVERGGPPIAGFFADQVCAKGRLRGNNHDLFALEIDFETAAFGADEIERMFAVGVELDERALVDGVGFGEIAEGEFLKKVDGVGEFAGLTGLSAGKVRGFETAGVVFVFGFAAFVGGFGVGGSGGFIEEREMFSQSGDDLFDEGGFVHVKKVMRWQKFQLPDIVTEFSIMLFAFGPRL